MRQIIATFAALAIAGCADAPALKAPEPGLERMLAQSKALPYEPSRVFADGAAMREAPAGTVARDAEIGAAPPRRDRALLHLGRDRFETVCAACHGVLGDADTPVAQRMSQVRPRDLQSDLVRGYPPERIEHVIAVGYGLMPALAGQLDRRERWAVAEYVKALQLSRRVALAELPPPLAERAREHLP